MTVTAERPHRDTLYVEDAVVLEHDSYPGEQFILRVRAPECATHARPGSFAHIRCSASLPMRRPLSIMRADPQQGTVEFLYKAVGTGTRALSERRPGETLSLSSGYRSAMLDGDVAMVARYQVRFSGIVFPGETIVTSMWKEGDKILVEAKTKERDTPVITNAAITIRD